MKEKLLYLILGILIGAVITAGCFLVFSKSNQNNGPQMRFEGDRQNMVRPDNANFIDEGQGYMPSKGDQGDIPEYETNQIIE